MYMCDAIGTVMNRNFIFTFYILVNKLMREWWMLAQNWPSSKFSLGEGGWSRQTVDLSVFNNSFNSKGLILHDSEICGEKIQ